MAIVKTRARQDSGVARVDEGQNVEVRSTRDGTLFKADWKQAMVMEGRGFTINLGAFSTPVVGGGSGALVIDIDCPEFVIGIPTGTSIMPLRVEIELLITPGVADSDELDIVLAVDQDKVNAQATANVGTVPVIYNLNTLHSRASACWCNQQYSGTMTDPVLDLELAHVTKIFNVFGTGAIGVLWAGATMLYEPESPVIINGPAMLIGYFGGTKAMSGFACVQWLELPTTMI